MNAVVGLLATLLGSEAFLRFVMTVIREFRKKPDNAADDEWEELVTSSVSERQEGKTPADGNIMLEQDRIEQIKSHHRKGPPK